MAKYLLDLQKPHRQSLIELVNNDNAATVGTALTLGSVSLSPARDVLPAEGIAREFGVTLTNISYAPDTVEVFFNKVALPDLMTMPASDFQGWYDPDTWVEGTSNADAVNAFKAAAVRAGIDPTSALENITVSRIHKAEENRFYIVVALDSYVFKTGAEFVMPKHFSETVTVTELNGFIYSPIALAAVVD